MSIQAITKVWDLDLQHPEQLILLALANYADENGASIFPSIELIAWRTGYTKRQVQRIIGRLKQQQIIRVIREAGRGRPTEYLIDFDMAPQRRAFKRIDKLSMGMRREVIAKFEQSCAYCSGKGDAFNGPDNKAWHIDRVIPGSRGGEYVWGNVALSCSTCNRKRGDAKMTPLNTITCGGPGVDKAVDNSVDNITKGAMDGIPGYDQGCHLEHKRVSSGAQKDAIAMASDPSVTVNNRHKDNTSHLKSDEQQIWPSPFLLIGKYNLVVCDDLPAVEKVTPARLKKARDYLRIFPDESFWDEVFKEINASLFLRGRTNGLGHITFKATFDWLLTRGKDGTENAAKVFEGRYRNGA